MSCARAAEEQRLRPKVAGANEQTKSGLHHASVPLIPLGKALMIAVIQMRKEPRSALQMYRGKDNSIE